MKTSTILLIALTALAYPSIAQSPSESTAKNALKQIWTAYMAWNNSNPEYLEPADYIIDKASGRIIGQDLISYGDKKYTRVSLTWNGEVPTEGKFNDYQIYLTWQGNQVSNIKMDLLSDFDYTVKNDGSGNPVEFKSNKVVNSLTMSKKVEYTNGKLTTITAYESKSNKPWMRSIKKITYNAGETLVSVSVYKTGKSNEEKNIAFKSDAVYKNLGNNSFFVDQGLGEKNTITYNAMNQIVQKKIERGNKLQDLKYDYVNDTLFKLETNVSENNNLVEKKVDIYTSRIDLPESLPLYEREKGRYKFNSAGELIWESHEGKYREKVNGLWSDWMFFKY